MLLLVPSNTIGQYVGIAGIFDILPIIVVISCPPGDPGVVWFPNPLADGDPVYRRVENDLTWVCFIKKKHKRLLSVCAVCKRELV